LVDCAQYQKIVNLGHGEASGITLSAPL